MLIVSQNEKEIFNFNRVTNTWIDTDVLDSKGEVFEICADGETLGYYKTEERAKEVLIEIMQSYVDSENYKYVNGLMRTEELNRLQKGLVYEMPKE